MQGYQIRRVLIIIVAIVVVVFLVAQAASFVRRLADGDDGVSRSDRGIVLSDYDTTASQVRLTYDGPVVAREDHYSIRVSVSAQQRVLEVFRGYDGSAVVRKTFKNTAKSYQTFIRAIAFYNFAKTQDNSVGDDERGICPTRTRTIVELRDDGERLMRLWSADCDTKGTLAGNSRSIRGLFQDQIPEYQDLVRDYRF